MRKGQTSPAFLFRGPTLRRNLLLALLVGTLLSLANQFDALLTQPWTPHLGMKLVFNYLIPFAVATASAWVNRT